MDDKCLEVDNEYSLITADDIFENVPLEYSISIYIVEGFLGHLKRGEKEVSINYMGYERFLTLREFLSRLGYSDEEIGEL